jgi:hypothetical protein
MNFSKLAKAIAPALLATLAIATPAPAQDFAPPESADIRPGAMTDTGGNQCTANFIFSDDAGTLYLGQAAHCASAADEGANGCEAPSQPLGARVDVAGASEPGTLAYSSWLTMQEVGETDESACQYNDFALVRLDPADGDAVNPTIPVFGGPTGIADSTQRGDTVYSYARSPLRLGLDALAPLVGTSLGQRADGWTHDVLTVPPGIPGDSGAGFVDASGRAFGVLSTLELLPRPATNGVGDLSRALAYLERHSSLDVALVPGTESFRGRGLIERVLPRRGGPGLALRRARLSG